MSNNVPAVAAAIRILERIAMESPRTVSPGTLSADLGINRSTCYNILGTLQQAGWATSLGVRSGWALGPGLLALTGVSNESTRAVVQEEIDILSRKLGYVIFAAQQDGSGGYTVTATSDPRRGVRVIVDVGDRFPFSAPALMQAFHAFAGIEAFQSVARGRVIEKFTERTATSWEELARAFAQVRARGYATSVQEFSLAQSAAAAPVFDANERVSMALGTLAFSAEVNDVSVHSVGRDIRDGAERITRRTGGVFPSSPDSDPEQAAEYETA